MKVSLKTKQNFKKKKGKEANKIGGKPQRGGGTTDDVNRKIP
jgi:hypothetical protein